MQIGDVVSLKSQGDTMTVTEITGDHCECSYINPLTGLYVKIEFNKNALIKR